MNCQEAAERITALVDGELSPAEREETERHVAGCPACREALAAERAMAERLRAAPRPALPAGFSASVMAKVGGGPAAAAAPPPGRNHPKWPMFAALRTCSCSSAGMSTPRSPEAGIMRAIGRSVVACVKPLR